MPASAAEVPATAAEIPATAPVVGAGHLVIVGPTASGKSALALALAEREPGAEIVSVDAMAVYRGMDIATAKPSPSERRRVVHHMIDVVDPDEEYGVAEYQRQAAAAVADIERRGRRAIVVGGTGLYVRALVDGLDLPRRWPAVAAELEARADAVGGMAELYRLLVELDPMAASRIEPGNRRRLVRALEVTVGSGRPFSSYGPGLRHYRPTPALMVALDVDRAELDRRVVARLHAWLRAGLVDEVRQLAARWQPLSRTARQAVAYRELLAHLEGRLSLEEAVDQAERRSRALVRRQQAWFRRDPRVQWLAVDGDAVDGDVAIDGDVVVDGDVVTEVHRRWTASRVPGDGGSSGAAGCGRVAVHDGAASAQVAADGRGVGPQWAGERCP